jgi:membrane-associated protease RseP (regulator of RpoE activity)
MTLGIPANYTALVHPVAYAGYVGFLITGLNYFPIGQLDGGHVARALFGQRYHRVVSIIGVVILFLFGYWLMALLAFFLFSGRHPGPVDDVSPLSNGRKILGVLSWLIPVLVLPPSVSYF